MQICKAPPPQQPRSPAFSKKKKEKRRSRRKSPRGKGAEISPVCGGWRPVMDVEIGVVSGLPKPYIRSRLCRTPYLHALSDQLCLPPIITPETPCFPCENQRRMCVMVSYVCTVAATPTSKSSPRVVTPAHCQCHGARVITPDDGFINVQFVNVYSTPNWHKVPHLAEKRDCAARVKCACESNWIFDFDFTGCGSGSYSHPEPLSQTRSGMLEP